MRIKRPEHFSSRVIEKFAFFPITITQSYRSVETRWLEKVKIKQTYVITPSKHYWKNEEFVN